jgi:hypothetical protein
MSFCTAISDQNGITMIPQYFHSRDLALAIYCLCPRVKTLLKECRFQGSEEVKDSAILVHKEVA